MKGETSNQTIVPQAKGYLLVPTIQDGKYIEALCFIIPKFASTLLSDSDVLKSRCFWKKHSRKSMLKLFEKGYDVSNKELGKCKNQQFDDIISLYDHNYGIYILHCVHKHEQNQNV